MHVYIEIYSTRQYGKMGKDAALNLLLEYNHTNK